MPPAKANRKVRMTAEHKHRTQQLEITQGGVDRLETALRSISEKDEQCKSFADHLSGFYAEVDKLAKGKTLVPATDLIVEQANNIVRDAKTLIEGDPYLDRIKEFVPAGDNPVYPDVLLTARVVQQAVGRYQRQLDTPKKDWLFWVLSGRRSQIEFPTVEVDGVDEVLLIAETARRGLDPLNP